MTPGRVVVLVTALAWTPAGIAAVSVTSDGGSGRVNGFAVHDAGDNWEIEIYRSFRRTVPKDRVTVTHYGDPRAQVRTEVAAARAKLGAGDVAGRLALARRAREAGLTITAALLLHEAAAVGENPKVTAALAALCPVPKPPERAAAVAAAPAFLAAPDDEAKRQALRAHDTVPAAWLPELRRELWAAFAAGQKLGEGDGVIKHAQFEGKVHVERWARDSAARERKGPWPLVLSLHGGGRDSGHWKNFAPTARKLFAKHLDRFVLVAPTVLARNYAEWGGNPMEEVFVFRALDAVKRSFPIDTDRVYVAGNSMGGYGTWHFAGHRGDVFAGAVSSAGGILIGTARGETWGWGIIGNLRHTAVAFCHGGKDKPAPPWSDRTAAKILDGLAEANPERYPHEFHYFPEKGHGLPGKAMAACVAFVAERIRDPRPRDLTWEPKRIFNRQFAWLYLDEPRCFTRVEARLRANNVIDLDLVGIDGGLSLLLDADLVDLDKPVEVLVGGARVFHGRPRPSLRALAESIADRFDPHLVFTHRIDL